MKELDPELRELVRMAANAYLAEMHGEYCTCAEPDIVGRKATLCLACGYINQAAINRVERAMRSPHSFEPLGEGLLRRRMCGFCSGWREDLRHQEGNHAGS